MATLLRHSSRGSSATMVTLLSQILVPSLRPLGQTWRPIKASTCFAPKFSPLPSNSCRYFCNDSEEKDRKKRSTDFKNDDMKTNDMETNDVKTNDVKTNDVKTNHVNDTEMKLSMSSKFSAFSDDENEIVLDMQEEMMSKSMAEDDGCLKDVSEDGVYLYREKVRKRRSQEIFDLNLSRGEDGVFDLIDLVQALKLEHVYDVVVIKVPPEKRYCDYMVIGTAKSAKHLTASHEFLNKLYKLKKSPEDPFLTSIHDRQYNHRRSPWQVMDFKNIVLHLFLPDARQEYDLETLWTVGPQFDEKTVRPKYDPLVDMMEKHLQFIESLDPKGSEKMSIN